MAIDPAVLAAIQANVADQTGPYTPNQITGAIPALAPILAAASETVAAATPAGTGTGTTQSDLLQIAKVVAAPTGGGATITFDGVNNTTAVPYIGTAPALGDQVFVLRQPPLVVILGTRHM